MKFFDRLLTIVVTATLTSIVWIVFGSSLLEMADERQGGNEAAPVSLDANSVDGDRPVEVPEFTPPGEGSVPED
ncbi:hypothetical protein [Erythrobacter rubeus]|uniref:Uncharacterized protein n=1 Tax=Erythrobacter rubeus TaxID=2760803 RepID=A0ABR8KN43_9SPHN|nr:hypothetical protein [Erythrobacter rubeus]MBD2842005.1 hypothetical protein [Erythrobacter rubeus]